MPRSPDFLIYGVNDKPPLVKLLLLGFQHVLLMAVYLVIVVLVVREAHAPEEIIRSAISMGMIALAISTVLQALTKGPIGSGYLAAPVVSAIFLEPSLLAAHKGGLALVFGMTIFAGIIEIIMSRFIHRLRAFFPPGISGLIITIVGIQLGILSISKMFEINIAPHSYIHEEVFIAGLTLFIMISLSVWWHGAARLMCSFWGLTIGFLIALVFGLIPQTSLQTFRDIPFFAFPHFNYISYHFDTTLIVPFLIAGIAASLRTVGVITTCQRINDADWKRPNIKTIEGGMLADSIGCLLAGLFGVPGINTSPSLVGLSKAAGATSRYIAFSVAFILVVLAFLPQITNIFLILPPYIIGAALLFTSSFMIVGGIQIMGARNIDTRMTYVIGLALLFGISRRVFPHFYESLPYVVQLFSNTTLSLTIVIAIVLNLIFRIGIKQKATLEFEGIEKISLNQVRDFIIQRGSGWDIDQELLERCVITATSVIKHLREANLILYGIKITIVYDQIDLVIAINYRGDLLVLPFVGQQKEVLLEEESFAYGLGDFLTGVYPDRFEAKKVNEESIITFGFVTA